MIGGSFIEISDCGLMKDGNKYMKFPEITKKEFLESISNGVKEAILTMTETGDGYTGEIIREPFLDAISRGIEQGTESLKNEIEALTCEVHKYRMDTHTKEDKDGWSKAMCDLNKRFSGK